MNPRFNLSPHHATQLQIPFLVDFWYRLRGFFGDFLYTLLVVAGVGFSAALVCLCVCLCFRMISQRPLQLGSPN